MNCDYDQSLDFNWYFLTSDLLSSEINYQQINKSEQSRNYKIYHEAEDDDDDRRWKKLFLCKRK